MYGGNSVFSSFFNMISAFGEVYSEAVIMFCNSVFIRPLLFIFRRIKRFLRFFFRLVVMFFSPAGVPSRDYADDVTRAGKQCLKTLFTHPFSLPSVLFYYMKKAAGRYEFSLKNMALWVLPLVLALVLTAGAGVMSHKTLCLEISADGETLGYVTDENAYIEAKNSARQKLSFAGKQAELPAVSYSLAITDKSRVTDNESLCDVLVEKSGTAASDACGVFIDGELFAVIGSEEEGRSVLDKILSSYESEEKFVVSFAEEIEFRQGLYTADSVITKNEFEKALLQGEKTVASYIVLENDTMLSIASAHSMTIEQLYELNSLDEESSLQAGQLLNVYETAASLTIKEVKAEITAQEVDYEKIEIKTNALYSGTSRVLLEGKKGYDQVTSLVTYIGGEKTSVTEAGRLTVSKPVAERIQVGTKPLDEAYSNSMGGIFLWPIIGAYGINSDYGWRWGKLHAGIDLGMGNEPGTSLGKTIIAVAQGTVIVAGTHSSYGYYVIIDHGGGLQTLYAHCLANSLMVVPGQIVAAGEPIARVGSTGYSTGPHLHFEVRVNGNRVNPRPYLGI